MSQKFDCKTIRPNEIPNQPNPEKTYPEQAPDVHPDQVNPDDDQPNTHPNNVPDENNPINPKEDK